MVNEDTSGFIIAIRPSARLEELTAGSKLIRTTPKILQNMREEKQKMMEPVKDYLDNLGLREGFDYCLSTNICSVTADLTSQQAEDLKKEPYVKGVVRDTIVRYVRGQRVDPPKVS